MTDKDATTPVTLPSGPHGLGGWLWCFAIPLLFLPYMALGSAMPRALAGLWFTDAWMADWLRFSILVLDLALLIYACFAAETFFRRSRSFPAIAKGMILFVCLMSLCVDLALNPGPFRHSSLLDILLRNLVVWTIGSIAWLYLHRSRRVRNTFDGHPLLTDGRPWWSTGPCDWGRGAWLSIVALCFLAFEHATSIPDLIDSARLYGSDTGRSLEDANYLPGSGGAWLAEMSRAARQYEPYARAQLLLHAIGTILATTSLLLFARRIRWPIMTSAGSVLLLLVAEAIGWRSFELYMDSVVCFDCNTPQHGIGRSLFIAITSIAAMLLPAVRRRFRNASDSVPAR
jgi:hypothetical protein